MPAEQRGVSDHSPLRLFIKVCRNFGVETAVRVAYFKLRGTLFPALALPNPSVANTTPHEVSIFLDTAEHDAATIGSIVDLLASRGKSDWEICVCERVPVEPEMAQILARCRGTKPWIRIVTADMCVDEAIVAQWAVEQATGEYVALVASGYAPQLESFSRLLARLYHTPEFGAAALIKTNAESNGASSPVSKLNCCLLLQRKSGYLAAFKGRWALTAPELANSLERQGAAIVYEPTAQF
jgi:hypothetical protein